MMDTIQIARVAVSGLFVCGAIVQIARDRDGWGWFLFAAVVIA